MRFKIYSKKAFIFLTQIKTIYRSNTQRLNSNNDRCKFIDLINGNKSEYDQIHGLRNVLVNDFVEIKIITFSGPEVCGF